MRRRNMPKDDRFRLEGEDMREARELRHYYVSTITAEVARLMPSESDGSSLKRDKRDKSSSSEGGQGESQQRIRRKPTPAEAADAQKAAESRDQRQQYQARTSGNPEWVTARGEDGTRRGRDGSHESRDDRTS